MLEIVMAESEAQIQQVRELSRGYVSFLDEFDKALGIYDPETNKVYGYVNGEAVLPGDYIAPDGCLLLALDDGTPAGCVALRKQDANIGEMRMLFVAQEFQGRGIGRLLVVRLIDEATKLGCTSLRLETSPDMRSAYQLYRSLGFHEVQPYHEVLDSLKNIEIFMEKALV